MQRSRITVVALVAALLVALDTAAGITTTESLVEATHTTLPVVLQDRDRDRDDDAVTRSSDLAEAESKDPQRLEIIKQIRKVNQDGSYTVGYEADDGTFKIESRDVLGNVKGTYGYIDANGDIKRVSYGGGTDGRARQTTAAVTPVTEDEEIVHIPPRFNRSQHHQQLLVPTTRRPPNYQPPPGQPHLLHPHHASTLRPSVIQTIPRKRPGYTMTTSTVTATTATQTVQTTTPTTTTAAAGSSVTASAMMASESTTEMPPSRSTTYGEQSTASSHTTPLLHTKPAGLLIIRPTPLPYQTLKTAEQLARPERLVDAPSASKIPVASSTGKKSPHAGVRGNFLRRQLPPSTGGGESGEQFEAHQQQHHQQQLVYGQPADGGDGVYGRPQVYSTHPAPRIPAAVLAARQRAAHIQSVLQSQSPPTTERVYVKQPVRSGGLGRHHHEPAPSIVYEPSTEPSSENAYVTDSPAANTRAAIASETEPEAEERRPIFRPRPTLEYRPRETQGTPMGPRYRTPYGLPPPPPPPFGLPYSSASASAGDEIEEIGDRDQPEYNGLAPYRQQRRLPLPAAAAAADTVYNQQQQQQQYQQQQQPQNAYPIPVPYPGGRLPPSPYYYDIPAERPLTARDFERILQVLIYRHQQLQVAQQAQQALRYPPGAHGGGYGGVGIGPAGYHGGGFPYNPYFPGPSAAAPYGQLAGSYAGYPQQQIPRPPLPFPYGGPYDGGYPFQNPFYSPSAPSPSAAAVATATGRGAGADPVQGHSGGPGYGFTAASRRQGQYYGPPLEIGGSTAPTRTAASSSSTSNGDFLPPEVRESLLYRMLMLAIQAPAAGSGEVTLPALAASSTGLALQGAPSMPNVQRTQPTLKPADGASTVAAAATMATQMYSKKPVRSVQILGEE